MSREEELLIPREALLTAGVHIGTKIKEKEMELYIFRVRADGLAILDIKKTDERIRIAAKFLSRFEPPSTVVVSAREYGWEPVKKFCKLVGAVPIVGRFVPGTFSNPILPSHVEPKAVLVSDPNMDSQAVAEASLIGVAVVALCSTNNRVTNIDLVVPANNKGRRSLATIFWLLAREVLREQGALGKDEDLPLSIDEFEEEVAEEAKEEVAEEAKEEVAEEAKEEVAEEAKEEVAEEAKK